MTSIAAATIAAFESKYESGEDVRIAVARKKSPLPPATTAGNLALGLSCLVSFALPQVDHNKDDNEDVETSEALGDRDPVDHPEPTKPPVCTRGQLPQGLLLAKSKKTLDSVDDGEDADEDIEVIHCNFDDDGRSTAIGDDTLSTWDVESNWDVGSVCNDHQDEAKVEEQELFDKQQEIFEDAKLAEITEEESTVDSRDDEEKEEIDVHQWKNVAQGLASVFENLKEDEEAWLEEDELEEEEEVVVEETKVDVGEWQGVAARLVGVFESLDVEEDDYEGFLDEEGTSMENKVDVGEWQGVAARMVGVFESLDVEADEEEDFLDEEDTSIEKTVNVGEWQGVAARMVGVFESLEVIEEEDDDFRDVIEEEPTVDVVEWQGVAARLRLALDVIGEEDECDDDADVAEEEAVNVPEWQGVAARMAAVFDSAMDEEDDC